MMGAVGDTSRMAWALSLPRFLVVNGLCVDNASLKSERFLNGPVFPDLLREIHQFCLYRKYPDACHVMREILVRKSVHFDIHFFISIMFELECTKIRIYQKAIVDPLITPLEASLFQVMGLMILSSFLEFFPSLWP